MRRSVARWLVFLSALTSVGCAENAFLELQIQLPPAPPSFPMTPPDEPPEGWFAQVQVTGSDIPLEIAVMGNPLESETIELTGAPVWDCISVESGDESVDLNVRVRFCLTANCLGLAEAGTRRERWYTIEHPFYVGQRTYHQIVIDQVPECEVNADCAGWGVCGADGQCTCTDDAQCPSADRCLAEPGMPGNCVDDVEKCEVAGCIGGESGDFCLASGEHFCEGDDEFITRDDTVQCTIPN